MAPDPTRTIISQLPGTLQADLLVQNLFNPNSAIETFECEVMETGLPNADISVLKVKGGYTASTYLEVEQKTLNPDDTVDVVGYPGRYDEVYIHGMHRGALDRDAVKDVTDLFPKCELIVSHGNVHLGGNTPTYYLSTVIGMSGSPVVKEGKVVGIIIPDHLALTTSI
jgi:hypothetical protein